MKAGGGDDKPITRAEVMEAIQGLPTRIVASLETKFKPLLKNTQVSEQVDAVHHPQRTARCSAGDKRFWFPFACGIFFKSIKAVLY